MKSIVEKSAAGKPLSDADIRTIIETPPERLDELLRHALALKERRFGRRIQLCAIINARSGHCSEDCRFCAQSAHYHTNAPEHRFVGADRIKSAAAAAFAKGVARFGIVTSGKSPGRNELTELGKAVRAVREAGPKADVSVGILDDVALSELISQGLCGVHHNLETSRRYFPQVCSTHAYDEDVEAVRQAVGKGLYVCSGGIFGIGESWDDRVDLALTLRELGVNAVPMNFLQAIPGTPFEGMKPLSRFEASKILALYRFLLPDRHIRICGGRSIVFGKERREALVTGASGIMTGDYLTTKGETTETDLQDAAALGLSLDTEGND